VSNESALKKQNKVLKEILNSSWDGIAIITLDGKFKFVNKAFVPLFAYSEKELLSLNFVDLITDEYKEDFICVLNDTNNEYNHTLEIACKRENSQILYVRTSLKLMSNKSMYILNVSDINEQKIKNKLSDSYLLQLDLNLDGFITNASEAFYKITSYTKQYLIGLSYLDLLSSLTVPFAKDTLARSIKDKTNHKGKLVINKEDKSTFTVNYELTCIKNKYGDIISFSIAMTNTSSISSNKQKELEVRLVDEEEKLSIMSDTMRTVAHEWRQPLNAISLGAQELIFELDFEDDIQKETIKEQLEKISHDTQGLSNVIESFQDITDLKGSKKKRNIKEIVNEALKISDLRGNWIHITNEPTKAFRTYPKELSAAVSSILTNANEVLQDKENKELNILTYDDGANIVCELSNNGGHIDSSIINKIFTPYFSTKEEKNGVGLSLYVCKVIVELHLKGSIKVDNIDDDIVKFTLKFPKGALE